MNSQRYYGEELHAYRDPFARDRDRILYSKEYRRLSGKTQVFVAGYDDHARTRLTHTLEVAQIARTISTALNLNENLCEAIALGHDVGHTPFGHMGERTLNLFMNGCDQFKDFNSNLPPDKLGFKHNWQGIRVLTKLEKYKRNYTGLNLTNYTLWGILNHSSLAWKPCEYKVEGICSLRHINNKCKQPSEFQVSFYGQYEQYLRKDAWTIEGCIVACADEIAQRHHDIEDGLEARIIDKDELLETFRKIFNGYLNSTQLQGIEYAHKEGNKSFYLPFFSGLLVDFYVSQFIGDLKNTLETLKSRYSISSNESFERAKQTMSSDLDLPDAISFEPGFLAKDNDFKNFLRCRILNSYLAQSMDGKSNYIMRQSIKAYLTNPQQLPDETIYSLYANLIPGSDWERLNKQSFTEVIGYLRNSLNQDHSKSTVDYRASLLRTICDYIAGMTDQYALQRYELLYGANSFRMI